MTQSTKNVITYIIATVSIFGIMFYVTDDFYASLFSTLAWIAFSFPILYTTYKELKRGGQ